MTHIKQVRVWENAHDRLEELAALLAEEKGLTGVSLTDAASIAILEAFDRRTMATSVAEAAARLPDPS